MIAAAMTKTEPRGCAGSDRRYALPSDVDSALTVHCFRLARGCYGGQKGLGATQTSSEPGWPTREQVNGSAASQAAKSGLDASGGSASPTGQQPQQKRLAVDLELLELLEAVRIAALAVATQSRAVPGGGAMCG
jgi:hypothetical protein